MNLSGTLASDCGYGVWARAISEVSGLLGSRRQPDIEGAGGIRCNRSNVRYPLPPQSQLTIALFGAEAESVQSCMGRVAAGIGKGVPSTIAEMATSSSGLIPNIASSHGS